MTADDSLWVGDRQNRVLRFSNASTKLSGAAADGVIGQPDFTTFSAELTSRGMYAEFNKPFVDGNGALWVGDSTNNRVLRFSPPTDAVLKVTSITKSGTTVTVGFQGTAGLSYRLNQSTNLNFTTPNIKSTITLAGTTSGSLQDTTATEPAAFYRVESQ